MSYSTGLLRHRVEILRPTAKDGKFGPNSGKMTYDTIGIVWASVDFQKGLKAVREGAVDGTDYVLIRMRWNAVVNRDSYLREGGVTYQIMEFHADRMMNIIQIKAQEVNIKQ